MHDAEIIRRIGELADEERTLEEVHVAAAGSVPAADRDRLEQLGETLDRLWDLLRQRRALRSSGRSPEEAVERPAGTVEHYLQ